MLTEAYAYAMKSEYTLATSFMTNPNFVYGSLFGGMCRAFNDIAELNSIKNDTDNFEVCVDFVYEETNPANNQLDAGEFVTTVIGFRPL